MENERQKKLLETVKGFNKKYKSEIFTLGKEIKELEVIPSGVKVVDNFIGGGFKKGAHTIIWGIYSVGKTALILQTIANAQKLGKLVCYVNTEKPIDPQRFEFFGVNLNEMIYIEAPENAEQALEAMRTLCKNKVIDLFVVDSTNGLCPKSVQEGKGGSERSLEKKNVAALPLALSNFYNIVNAHVFRSKASVIWIGQARTKGIGGFFAYLGLTGGNAQLFYAYQIMSMKKGEDKNSPVKKFKEYFFDSDKKLRYMTVEDKIGFDVIMKLTKTNSSKSVRENSEIHIPYLYDKGFIDRVEENDDIPIRIDPITSEEDRIEIEKMLIEKGILPKKDNPFVVKKFDQTICDDVKLEDKPVKKKRGRPKKNENNR